VRRLERPGAPERSEPLAYTAAELARRLRKRKATVYQLIEAGRLPTVTFGERRLVPRWAVDALLGKPVAPDDDPAASTPLERVLGLLPLLSPTQRVRVAQAALSPSTATARLQSEAE
jgi:excisionase family DNA binding protein